MADHHDDVESDGFITVMPWLHDAKEKGKTVMPLPSQRLRNASHQADALLRDNSLDADSWRQFQDCLTDIAEQMAAIERSCSPIRRDTVIAFRRSLQPSRSGPYPGGGDAA